MSAPRRVLTCAVPPAFAWRSTVERSIEAWKSLHFIEEGQKNKVAFAADLLRAYDTIDAFLDDINNSCMFWFFQRRDVFLAQRTMQKWDRERLNDYVLLPGSSGFIKRQGCFFLSHYWRHKEHPDPDGKYLRLFQENLGPADWAYVWVDWACTPQAPRTQAEEIYFVSSLIRHCAFDWFYLPFEARMWILYEIAEYSLTVEEEMTVTEDMQEFARHIREMTQTSVASILKKYKYRCANDLDKAFLTSSLEVLVLLKILNIDILALQHFVDTLIWQTTIRDQHIQLPIGWLELLKYEGILTLRSHSGGKIEVWNFSPFPMWIAIS